MPWQKRSTVSTKPRSSTGAALAPVRAASSIWRSCSIGPAVACCRGAYRSRWRRRSMRGRRVRHARHGARNLQHGSRQSVHWFNIPAASRTHRHHMDARARGGTTSLSNGYGAVSNTRRCICGPRPRARPAPDRPLSELPEEQASDGMTPDHATAPGASPGGYPQRLHLSTRRNCSDNRNRRLSSLSEGASAPRQYDPGVL